MIEHQTKEIQEWKVRMTESPWIHLMHENQALAKRLEELEQKFKLVEFTAVTEAHKFSSPQEVPSSTSVTLRKVIPKLNLKSSIVQGFHDEFLEHFQEFSISWRDAMKEGR